LRFEPATARLSLTQLLIRTAAYAFDPVTERSRTSSRSRLVEGFSHFQGFSRIFKVTILRNFETEPELRPSTVPFSEPSEARRGRVGWQAGFKLLHFCQVCGAWAPFGFGVNLRAGQLGRWFCAEHRTQGRK